MRAFLFMLLTTSSLVFCQNDTIYKQYNLGTVSVERLNIVYRGIVNPISISVSDAKSFTVQGEGLRFENGKYSLSPGKGSESIITLKIIKKDDTEVIEKKSFRIRNIPAFIGTINGIDCSNVEMTKKDLQSALITTSADNFPIDFDLKVVQFSARFGKGNVVICDGNMFNDQAISKIKKLKIGSTIIISEIRTKANFDGCIRQLAPIVIKIVKE